MNYSDRKKEEQVVIQMLSENPDEEKRPLRLPEGASIFSRKVARSGHISYEGRPYFISKALADRLVVDAFIPLHKEYPLI